MAPGACSAPLPSYSSLLLEEGTLEFRISFVESILTAAAKVSRLYQ
jgi:hypothetical protein